MADNDGAGSVGDLVDSSVSLEESSVARTGWRQAGPWAYAVLVALWFFEFYAPHKFLTYYTSAARPLTWLPELMLWVCAIQWLRWPEPKRGYPAFTRYMLMLLLGTAVAYFLGNWGVARDLLRLMYQWYLLALVTLTFCSTLERARPIFSLYLGYFLWFALWGLVSLKTSPLGADVDPGARVIVFWHTSFDNRDAFGPLMVAGMAYSIYYLQATRPSRTRLQSMAIFASIGLCGLGFITSFGRGAFLGFLAVAASMWLRSRRKVAVLVGVLVAIGVLAMVAPSLMSRYVETMQSITGEGTQKGTGADRADLWGVAWREFLSSPIVGVGTENFGVGASRVLSADEATAGGYTRGKLWGRAVHSAPMQLLAEQGLLGAIIAILLIADFFRTNRRTREFANRSAEGAPDGTRPDVLVYVNGIALGVRAAFLGYLVSSIFYELLYSQMIWDIIILNRMLYFASGAYRAYEPSAQSPQAQ